MCAIPPSVILLCSLPSGFPKLPATFPLFRPPRSSSSHWTLHGHPLPLPGAEGLLLTLSSPTPPQILLLLPPTLPQPALLRAIAISTAGLPVTFLFPEPPSADVLQHLQHALRPARAFVGPAAAAVVAGEVPYASVAWAGEMWIGKCRVGRWQLFGENVEGDMKLVGARWGPMEEKGATWTFRVGKGVKEEVGRFLNGWIQSGVGLVVKVGAKLIRCYWEWDNGWEGKAVEITGKLNVAERIRGLKRVEWGKGSGGVRAGRENDGRVVKRPRVGGEASISRKMSRALEGTLKVDRPTRSTATSRRQVPWSTSERTVGSAQIGSRGMGSVSRRTGMSGPSGATVAERLRGAKCASSGVTVAERLRSAKLAGGSGVTVGDRLRNGKNATASAATGMTGERLKWRTGATVGERLRRGSAEMKRDVGRGRMEMGIGMMRLGMKSGGKFVEKDAGGRGWREIGEREQKGLGSGKRFGVEYCNEDGDEGIRALEEGVWRGGAEWLGMRKLRAAELAKVEMAARKLKNGAGRKRKDGMDDVVKGVLGMLREGRMSEEDKVAMLRGIRESG